MELLVANASGKPRRETLNGRSYLVTKMTMIVPGVLNGSKGPGFYPLEEMSAGTSAWNIMPIVRNHPVDAAGKAVSARQPHILNERGLGFVFNSSTSDKLEAEAWFDELETKRIDPAIYNSVERGDKIELSTGLDVSFDMTPGVFNGISYNWIARNHKPDHLAILTNGQGACNVRSGCGVNNQETSQEPSWVAALLEKVTNLVKPNTSLVTNQESAVVKLNDTERKGHVDNLITNCSCTYKETDREALNKLEDRVLVSLSEGITNSVKLKEAEEKAKKAEALQKAVNDGLQVGNDKWTLNEKNEWVRREAKPKEENVQNSGNPPKQLTEDEWLAQAPAGIRSAVANAQKIEKQHRSELITKLVSNIKDEKTKTATIARLETRSTEDLEADAAVFVGNSTQNSSGGSSSQSFQGAQLNSGNAPDNGEKPKPIPQTVWNWGNTQAPAKK